MLVWQVYSHVLPHFYLEFYCAYFNYPRFLFWWTVIILSSVKIPTHELTWRCTLYDLDPAHSDDVNCVKFLHCGVALVSSSSFLLYNCKWKNHLFKRKRGYRDGLVVLQAIPISPFPFDFPLLIFNGLWQHCIFSHSANSLVGNWGQVGSFGAYL